MLKAPQILPQPRTLSRFTSSSFGSPPEISFSPPPLRAALRGMLAWMGANLRQQSFAGRQAPWAARQIRPEAAAPISGAMRGGPAL